MATSDKSKRKNNSHTLLVKLNTIRELEQGNVTVNEVAAELNVHPTTVRSWEKNKNKLLEWSNSLQRIPKDKKRLSGVTNDVLDRAMWIWFREKRNLGVPLSGPMMQEKARMFNKEIGGDESFSASKGWLRSFKERYGIRFVQISGEKLSADSEAVDPFKVKFRDYVKSENLTVDQVFNCDESGLNWKLLPKGTLSARSEEAPSGLKGYKDRITIMACSNVSGTIKLPLFVIGKYANPRALKGKKATLPVSYEHQKSAWMTSQLFETWFDDEFVPQVKKHLEVRGLPPKALLLMDQCSSHKTIHTKDDIAVMFFPANTTALIQPMDQGCLQNLKLLYKGKLMKFVIECVDSGLSLTAAIKKIDIFQVIKWAATAWKEVTMTTIQKSWNKVWPWEDRAEICEAYAAEREEVNALLHQFYEKLLCMPFYQNVDQSQFEEWLHPLNLLIPDEALTDSEIIQVVTEENFSEESRQDANNMNEYIPENYPWTPLAPEEHFLDSQIRQLMTEGGGGVSTGLIQDINGNCEDTLKSQEKELGPENNNNLETDAAGEIIKEMTRAEAYWCLTCVVDFCKRNCYPQNMITALCDIQEEMANYEVDIHNN